ncbi:hypothetical protein [Nitrosopumilus ureiphilus]|uniref:hypothetical protein n=1 Tax=Nitrosopumilus ureiphilus TaxID=1470067 RepID=UPI001FEAC15C|nr:hypothetical protein [Nitrosopumilus ureiphilus]
MAIPIILLVGIPVLLGIAYVTPFDQPEEIEQERISEQPDFSTLYFILMGIWTLFNQNSFPDKERYIQGNPEILA